MNSAERRDLMAQALRQGAATVLFAAWLFGEIAIGAALLIWVIHVTGVSILVAIGTRLDEIRAQQEAENQARAEAATRAQERAQRAQEQKKQAREEWERAQREAAARAAAQSAAQTWREVLGFHPSEAVSRTEIEKRRRMLAKVHHPDLGGDPEMMILINRAADVALRMVRA